MRPISRSNRVSSPATGSQARIMYAPPRKIMSASAVRCCSTSV
jgi:hypothetical protein